MRAVKLSDSKALKAKALPAAYDIADARVPELKLAVATSGRKTWVVRIRDNGRNLRVKLGTFKASRTALVSMDTEQAREAAEAALDRFGRSGVEAQRVAILEAMPTLSAWFDKFKESNPNRLEPETMHYHGHRIKKYIIPQLGDLKLHEITRSGLEDMTLYIEKEVGARTANMSRVLVGTLLRWADSRDMMPDNWREPKCKAAAENPERADNFIPTHKAADFYAAVELLRVRPGYQMKGNETAADVILMALYTGARKSNVQSMEWDEINWALSRWNIPVEKSKTRKKSKAGISVPLIPPALEILVNRQKLKNGPFVFPNLKDPNRPMDNIKKSWDYVRETAGLPKVTFHGLRHTMATWQGQAGVNQRMIAASLGQMDLDSTKRYVHADIDLVRENMTMAIEANYKVIPDRTGQTATLETDKWLKIIHSLGNDPLADELRKTLNLQATICIK